MTVMPVEYFLFQAPAAGSSRPPVGPPSAAGRETAPTAGLGTILNYNYIQTRNLFMDMNSLSRLF
jgi:hypothetical protein